MLSLMSALPVNSHRNMEAFASARWLQTAESAQETRDPGSLFVDRIDRRWPKFHYARPGFELMITDHNGAL